METTYSVAFATAWGFRPVFRRDYERAALTHFSRHDAALTPARVVAEHRGLMEVITSEGQVTARLSGRLRHDAAGRADQPTVGDWVALRPSPAPTVVAVLHRQTHLTRQRAGRRTEAQVLAANIDTVFVVTSANADLSPRRIERYRRAVASGGAQPVVLLNKSDLVDDLRLKSLAAELPRDLPVVALSALHEEGFGALEPWLGPGATVALVGSSGVGKSTLVNRLREAEVMATGEVRATDSTGQHTTTHRQLVRLPTGAMLIDTPGLRELQLWSPEEAQRGATDPVARVAACCRFRDCDHRDEPGCAVRDAVSSGELTQQQWIAHEQLQRELAHQRRRQDVREARSQPRRRKKRNLGNKLRAKRR